MTAVEWFYQRMFEKDIEAVFKQAKEMEKQQMMDIFDDGCQWGYERQPYNAEEYYNEKFKNK